MNKNLKTALIVLGCSVLVSILVYVGFRVYATNNPLVVCGDDKYSDACLISYATSINLNKKPYIDCLLGDNYKDAINTDNTSAIAIGLSFGPTMFAGQFTDNTTMVGFYVSPANYTELQTVADNVLTKGVIYAQAENIKIVTQKVNDNVKSYLDSLNLSATEYKKQLGDLQPTIQKYLESFSMFNITTPQDNVRGDTSLKFGFLYFVDYASELTPQFYSVLLADLNTNYIDTGKMKMVYKDLPLSNTLASSEKLANAARCAGAQNKYFDYSDLLQSL